MFGITLGDIVVLVLVILILVVYRRMDRNNRSLEKVKRFTDKSLEDLHAVSEEKVLRLRDIAIEVDVHQQASRKVLGRLQDAEVALETKSQAMEELRGRMDTYNTALLELVGMTQKAEENISRLRDESAYIDKVGRRMRVAAGQLTQIEERIPKILDDVQTQNLQALSQAKEQMSDAFAEKINEIDHQLAEVQAYAKDMVHSMRGEVLSVQNDLSDRAEAYRRAFDEIERDYHARIQQAAEQGKGLETEVLAQLRAGFEQAVRAFDAQRAAHEQQVEQQFALQQEEMDKKAAGIAAYISDSTRGLGEQLASVRVKTDDELERLAQDLRRALESNKLSFMDDVEQSRKELASWQTDMQQVLLESQDELSRKIGDTRRGMEQELGSLVEMSERTRLEMERTLLENDREHQRQAEDFRTHLRERVAELEGSVYQLEQDLEGKLQNVQQKGAMLADTLLQRINQDVDAKTDSMREAIHRRVEDVNSHVDATYGQIETSFNSLKGRVDSWTHDSQQYMSDLDNQVHKLNEESRSANIEHQKTIQTHIEDTKHRLDSYEQALSTRVESLESFISEAESLVRNEFGRIEAKAAGLARENAEALDEVWTKSRQDLLDIQTRRFADLRSDLDAEEIAIGESVAQVRTGYEAEITAFRTAMNGALHESAERMTELQSMELRMEKSLEGWKLAVQGLEKEHGVLLADMHQRLLGEEKSGELAVRAAMDSFQNQMKDAVLLQQQNLLGDFKNLQEEAQLHKTQLQDGFREGIQQVQQQAQDLYNSIRKELDGSLGSQQQRLRAMMEAVESDITRLKSVSVESAARIESWEAGVRSGEERIRADIVAVRDRVLGQANLEMEQVANDFGAHKENLTQQVDEVVQKLKSEIGHVKGDVSQDLDFLKKHIEQVKLAFRDQVSELQNNAREIEDQAIAGLKDRIESLREEARELTRKYQDDFAVAMQTIQGNIAGQMEQYQSELKRIQTLASDIQNQFRTIKEESDRHAQVLRTALEQEQQGASRLLASAKEQFGLQVKSSQDELLGQLKQVVQAMASDADGLKAKGEKSYQETAQLLGQWQLEFNEKVKLLQNDASVMRKDAMSTLQERVDTLRDEARKMTGMVKQEIGQLLSEHKGEVEHHLKDSVAEFARIQDMHTAGTLKFQEIQDVLGKAETLVQREMESLRERSKVLGDQAKTAILSDIQKQREDLMVEIRQGLSLVAQDAETSRVAILDDIASLKDSARKELSKSAESMVQVRQEFQTAMEQALATHEKSAQKSLDETARRMEDSTRLARDSEVALARFEQDLQVKTQALEKLLEQYATTMAANIVKRSEDREQAALSDIERRLRDYESEIGYRIGKLETVNNDIDGLELAMRQSIDLLSVRIRDDLAKQASELEKKRLQDADSARKDFEQLRLEMLNVERGVDELKQRAYDNVSEKLKVFEDEFFVDLRSRSEKMQGSLGEWQEKVRSTLTGMEQKAIAEREVIEQAYGEQFKARLAEVQQKVADNFSRLEARYSDFQQGLHERMESSETAIQNFNQQVGREVEVLQTKTQDFIGQQFQKVSQDLDNRIRVFERDVESRISRTELDTKSRSSDLQSLVESVRSDVTIWQTQVLQQLKGSEAQVQQDLAGFRTRNNQTIQELAEEFERQKQEVTLVSASERSEIKRDLDETEQRIQKLHLDLESRGRELIDQSNRQFQLFSNEMNKRNNELASEVDERTAFFRSFVSDTREEFDGMQKRLMGKLEDDTKMLDLNLREIDKRLKTFLQNTKLFDRADALKEELEVKINTLRQEIEAIETQKRDLINLDPVIEKVRRLADDVNDKFQKLSQEKKRLEGLDEDYRKLAGLSQLVDQKLQQVTSSSDMLTQMQLSMRQIDEMQKSIDGKLDRLDKKSRLSDTTSEAVDRNYHALEEMEVKLRTMQGQFSDLPERVSEVQERLNALGIHKKDADAALKNLVQLDKIMKDIEARTAELMKARDWLARTETRMSEISREASDQVELLNSIVKKEMQSETAAGQKNGGGQAMGTRELVLKLANKGWKIEEIAKTTKLSRGEVELILEMNNA